MDSENSVGKKIRQFFRDLLGSRVATYMEVDNLRLRADFEERLKEKDQVISDLREEKSGLLAKIISYEQVIMPRASRAGAELISSSKPAHPNFGLNFSEPPSLTKWEQVQVEWSKKLAQDEEAEKLTATEREIPD